VKNSGSRADNSTILNRPLTASPYRIGTAAAVLAVLIIALPIRLHRAGNEASAETCLRLADHPPAEGHDAIGELERCSAVVPLDVELLADLGAAYEGAGRPLDAEKTYQNVLALDPSYADVHVRLATLLLGRGAAGDARDHAEQALRIQPNRARVRQLIDEIARSKRP
jgi:tetratricopeptide (TPR) repeat protein